MVSALVFGGLGFAGHPTGAADKENADDFLIVDCLLPAQVRQLGQNMTFLAPRQAIRTSARECSVRGGEFSRGDAGGPAGLRIWLPAAQKGDATAQTYVGEIFERGLGGQPDYAAAVEWYRRAADQNYARAQIALGALIEQGLGAPRDPIAAAKLFRRAAGLSADLPMGSAAQDKRVEELTSQLAAANASGAAKQQKLSQQDEQLRKLRQSLATRETDMARERDRLKAAQQKLDQSQKQSQPDQTAKAQELNKTLADRDRELERTKSAVAELRAKLAAAEKTQAQPTVDPAQLAQLKDALAQQQAAMAAQQAEASRLKTALQAAQANASEKDAKTQDLSKALADRDGELGRTKAAIGDLHAKLAVLEQAPKPPTVDPAQLARMRNQLSDAQAEMTAQQDETNRLRQELKSASAGSAARDKEYRDAVAKLEQQVKDRQAGVAAKDDEIKRLKDQLASLEVQPSTRSAVPASAARLPVPIPVADFGRYHALVIGINDYRRLPRLETPINDAKDLAQLLKNDYGFDVVTLFDADRYQILNALNHFRQTLTDKDNLLIYYAGHGMLDSVNQRGNWLPVDAESDSPANWISNIQITDILNAMGARQILVVADSCYSGTLTRDVATAIGRARDDVERVQWYKIMIAKPSRVALTSGGLEPVLDSSGGKHSMFAEQFIRALSKNTDAMATQELYQEIQPAVATRTADLKMHQVPEYAPIKMAGHEAGDFVFVKQASRPQ